VGNKVQGQDDLDFLRAEVGDDLLVTVGRETVDHHSGTLQRVARCEQPLAVHDVGIDEPASAGPNWSFSHEPWGGALELPGYADQFTE
ncbi:hypothetical protein, partial [Streptomyces sp. NPDC051576]|uniref:hypothetical protein n=1 Tax=Streptomyces sp. NPDC051576 TaxID=3155803 RepID=UPI003413D610